MKMKMGFGFFLLVILVKKMPSGACITNFSLVVVSERKDSEPQIVMQKASVLEIFMLPEMVCEICFSFHRIHPPDILEGPCRSRNLEDWKNLPGHNLLNNVSYHPLQKKHHLPF